MANSKASRIIGSPWLWEIRLLFYLHVMKEHLSYRDIYNKSKQMHLNSEINTPGLTFSFNTCFSWWTFLPLGCHLCSLGRFIKGREEVYTFFSTKHILYTIFNLIFTTVTGIRTHPLRLIIKSSGDILWQIRELHCLLKKKLVNSENKCLY